MVLKAKKWEKTAKEGAAMVVAYLVRISVIGEDSLEEGVEERKVVGEKEHEWVIFADCCLLFLIYDLLR